MTGALDRERFAALLAILTEPSSYTEQVAVRETAAEVALAAGMTFDQARAALRMPAVLIEHSSTTPIAPEPRKVRGLGEARAAAIIATLASDPSRSDRDVARELRCSPTLVGRARADAGLGKAVREVNRGGASYAMRPRLGKYGIDDQR